jgi:hypothetical protein
MNALLDSGDSRARRCLIRQLGRIAGPNSCTGPWTTQVNANLRLDSYRLHLGNRGTLSINATNLQTLADQVLHGGRTHGWSTPSAPDAVLLQVDGFDPGRRSYLYSINQRFAGATANRLLLLPLTLSVDLTVDIGPDLETASLKQRLAPTSGRDLTRGEILSRVTSLGLGAAGWATQRADSLGLTSDQRASISLIATRLRTTADSVAAALTRYLGERSGNYDGPEVRHRWHDAAVAKMRATFQANKAAARLLTRAQYLALPIDLRAQIEAGEDVLEWELRRPRTAP